MRCGSWFAEADHDALVWEALGDGLAQLVRQLARLLLGALQYGDDVLAAAGDDYGEAPVEEEGSDGLGQAGQGRVGVCEGCGEDQQFAVRVYAEGAQPVRDLSGTLRTGQDHVEQLAGEPQLDRLDRLLLGHLQAQEPRGLVECILLSPAQLGNRLQAEQCGVGVTHSADQEDCGLALLCTQVNLQRRWVPGQAVSSQAQLLRRQRRTG